MESAEKEMVEFTIKITPADAKGLVERWLLQVGINVKVGVRSGTGLSIIVKLILHFHFLFCMCFYLFVVNGIMIGLL